MLLEVRYKDELNCNAPNNCGEGLCQGRCYALDRNGTSIIHVIKNISPGTKYNINSSEHVMEWGFNTINLASHKPFTITLNNMVVDSHEVEVANTDPILDKLESDKYK